MNSICQILSNANFVQNDDRVWHPLHIKEFAYNDGDQAELYLLNAIREATDKSSRSPELAAKMIDWPSTYHLTSRRSNLLRPFEAQLKNKKVLEIGCGCGAITRFLGEAGAQVVSVEGSLRRATIARARCEDLDNVEIICVPSDELPDIGEFDFVLLIGVLEYARVFLGESGQKLLLDSCYSRLNENGKLFVAIENKLGIKYFAGAAEDHVGQPMFGVNNSYDDTGVMTFGRAELKEILGCSGFSYIEEYLPLPDYKLPTEIVTPLGWKKYSTQLTQLAIESAHKDVQGIAEPVFSVEQALKNIWQNNLAADLSNSFLFLAAKKEFFSENKILLHHYSDGRLPEYNKELIVTVNDNDLEVLTYSISKNSNVVSTQNTFKHKIEEQSAFFEGESLWLSLLNIVNKPGWTVGALQNWLKKWLDCLAREENISTELDKDTLLPGKYNDAMPFNILIDKNDNVKFIDLEWVSTDKISLGYVIFRGVLHSLLRITSVAASPEGENRNLQLLLEEILTGSNLNINKEDLESYWEREFEFMEQTQVGNVGYIRSAFKTAVLKTRISLIEYATRNADLASKINNCENNLNISLDKESARLKAIHQEEMASMTAANNELAEKNALLIHETQSKMLENQKMHEEISYLKNLIRELNDKINMHHSNVSDGNERYIHLERISHEQDKKIKELSDEINRLLSTNSWKLTKPLRFLMRLVRGQHQAALDPFKKITRQQLKKLYYKTPVQYRNKLLHTAFKLRPGWFLHHPEYQRINGTFTAANVNNQQLLTDFSLLPAKLERHPQNVALHCHIYYFDLIDEFVHHIAQVPFSLDVFVSVTSTEGQMVCKDKLSKLANINNLFVEIVPNRGRDIGPMFAHFGSRLKTYDFVGHIQSKKSLYNAGATLGWREYLFNALLGSKENIEKIFHQFELNKGLGIIYPQAFVQVPYAAFTWLANRADGHRLCSRMGIEMPDAYFNFPAGSMFWARVDALRPLFDLNLKWEDFPEELAQNDGTVAHAIERLLGVVPTALNYESLIIKDHQSPSWTTFRFDQQYFGRTFDTYQYLINDADTHIVAFDIFDTILTRPLLNPDHTKNVVMNALSSDEKVLFKQYRAQAEAVARDTAGRDIDIYEIYNVFAKLTKISAERCTEIAHLEAKTEYSSVYLRADAKELMSRVKRAGKKVVLISDMFLPRETVVSMLDKFEVKDWDELYLSSDIGLRKDTGKLYEYMFEKEGVAGSNVVMIGDNERSDLQLPSDFYKVRCLHLLRANDIAKSLTDYQIFMKDRTIEQDLNNELTLGLIIQKNLNKVANIEPDDLRLYSERAYQLGYNLVGPLLISFCEWLCQKAVENKIEHLYFLAREGKIIKEVFDRWYQSHNSNAIKSSYLQVSRRSVNVPKIREFKQIADIASIDFSSNGIETFLFERFGFELESAKWQEIYTRNLWSADKLVEIRNKDISSIEPLLKYLSEDIIKSAMIEYDAMNHYLEGTGIKGNDSSAIVDVGYSGTIQKSLNELLKKPVHGFYMATSHLIRDGMHPSSLTEGCFVSNGEANFIDSRIFSKSFALEQLLSANDAQIAKYVLNEHGLLDKVFKPLRDEEKATQPVRNDLQRGIMEYVSDALELKENFYPEFAPSLSVANKLYSGFVDSGKDKQNSVLQQLVLDDDYCGRGLVS
ncbi:MULTISPECIES: rhamnan synthesis F family protein [Pantoea]|jgi:predicted HAD superfamily hydrolase/SAM-dependent methyltransferase|uniref:rhamnan synthesis F family protein n=1 Tax=Pantoea TaxID=53335 RepID=UPI000EA1D3B3|nr:MULTISPECIES: rhamnan synthesis F family protein [Pantoea]MBZ6387063.1 methyltransferase domain-containing protein [Pantoea piersonii]MBZ6398834.1 methyltransferase domain-containing protein [Pantoea piersonii]MBZ6408052.1 methyltransferase domain-containing protein [Pantoea piersonii]MBZ6426885.1 methyltransferase domain-containing protein [Pantoea piersonii]NYB00800.1 methyltransferase domain-containing protein [Pantoea piersonii]